MAHVTIPAASPIISYTGDGTTVAFPFPFAFFDVADIKVYVGGDRQLSGITIGGVPLDGGFSGGTVTFAAPPANGAIVRLLRDIEIKRLDDYPYPSQTLDIQALNTTLDRLTAMLVEARRRDALALQVPFDAPPPPPLPSAAERASRYLAFDAAGIPIAAAGTAGPPISPFMATMLDDASADDALTTLEATAVGKALFRAADALAARVAIEAAQAKRLLYLTSDTTLTAAHDGFLIMPDATAGNLTITLPLANALGTARPIQLWFFRPDLTGNTVTVQRAGLNVIESGQTSLSLPSGRRFPMLSDAFAVWYTTIDGTPLGRAVLGAADAVAAQSLIGPWVTIANFAVPATALIEVPLPTTGYAAFKILMLGVYSNSSAANNDLYFRVKQGGVLINGAATYYEQGPYWLHNTGPAPISQTNTYGRLFGGSGGEPIATEHLFWPGYGIGGNNRGVMIGLGHSLSTTGRLTWATGTQVLAGAAQTDGIVFGWALGGSGAAFVANGRCVVMGLKA